MKFLWIGKPGGETGFKYPVVLGIFIAHFFQNNPYFHHRKLPNIFLVVYSNVIKLILKTEDQGKKTNAKALTLNIISGNAEAVLLYEKMGFKLIKLKNKKMEMEKTV